MTRSKVAAKYVNVQDRMPDESAQTTRVPKETFITLITRVGGREAIDSIDQNERMNRR